MRIIATILAIASLAMAALDVVAVVGLIAPAQGKGAAGFGYGGPIVCLGLGLPAQDAVLALVAVFLRRSRLTWSALIVNGGFVAAMVSLALLAGWGPVVLEWLSELVG